MAKINPEFLELLTEANPQDFYDCLKENFESKDQEQHYRMLAELYYNDKNHYKCLSAGCKAAMILYLALGR